MSWTDTYMQTSLRGIANKAMREPECRFRDLYRLLNEQNLRVAFYQLRKKAASGVDGMTFVEYEQNLGGRLVDLVGRLKGKRYKAKLVRRKHIPKGNGSTRPLGIPALEDKLLQLACAQILTAIYEGDFLDCSWGYRKGRGAREASRVLANSLHRGNYGWVVEADIKGFFDHLDHDWMVRMLEERVEDRAFIRLIRKWMKAGVLEEDGKVLHPAAGTPQGGIISPVLSNIYLHHVLDLWFENVVKKHCEGEVCMMRYADDFVCAFRYKEDAMRFEAALGRRLGKFQLAVAPEKTRLLKFSRYADEPNDAFEFLGFEFRWVRWRTGKMGVRRRTAPKKLQASVKTLQSWIIEHRNDRIRTIMGSLRRKLLGYWGYYGVRGNMRSLSKLYNACLRLLFKWLNRRSQRSSYRWAGFKEMLKHFDVPTPRITEPVYQKELFS